MIAALATNQLRWWGWRDFTGTSLCLGIALGWMQWAWALRGRSWKMREWIVATVAGTFLLPHVFLAAIGESRGPDTPIGEGMIWLLIGLGVGIFQLRILRRESPRAWVWIPANMLGFVTGRFLSLSMVSKRSQLDQAFFSPDPQILLASFLAGTVLGYLTSAPLETALEPSEEDNPEAPSSHEAGC